MTEFFRFLVETNLVTAAFVIGAIAFVIAIIGRFKTIIEPSPAMRFLLAVFGFSLMALSLGSYFVSSQGKPSAVGAPTQETTSVRTVQPSPTIPQNIQQPSDTPSIAAQLSTSTPVSSNQDSSPLREHKTTSIVGTGILTQGTYSDGMAPISESEITSHLNIQRIRLEENSDGCAIAFLDVDKIWFGSAVKTNLTINDAVVGTINGPTGRHGYIFNATIHSGDRVCVTYFEPSGFQIIFGPDIYYHYDSYCYRGNC